MSEHRSITVGVDARSLNREYVRGIGKVLSSIIANAPQHFRWRLFFDRPDLPMHLPDNARVESEVFEERGYRFKAWEQIQLPTRLFRKECDVLLFPANTASLWQRVPSLAIVHDTIPWQQRLSGAYNKFYWNHVVPAALRKAAGVVTISQSSANDILDKWPSLKSKVNIIPNGVDSHYLDYSAASSNPSGEHQRYFLYFGGMIPRKRLDWAVRVFERANVPAHELWICGLEREARSGFMDSLSSELKSRVRVLDFIPESDMPQLYGHASAIIYPSLYEGFGLPIVEASAVGTPCIFSPVSSMAELQGPGAIAVPVDSEAEWVNALNQCAAEPGLPAVKVQPAKDWAKTFAWESRSRAYCELLERIAFSS